MKNEELGAMLAKTVKDFVQKNNAELNEKFTALEKELRNVPPAEKGDKGDKGDSPSAEDVARAMEGLFSKWALGYERKADDILQRAVDKLRQPEDGKPGRDALDIENFDICLDDDGRTVKVKLMRGEDVVEKSLKIATILDKGVYRDGDRYEKGDAVTFGGSLWISCTDNPEGKPGISEAWRLAVKRGRDGRESVKIVSDKKSVKLGDKKDGHAG